MSTRSVKSSPSAIGSTLHSFPQHLNLNTERDVEHESLLQPSSARHLTQEEEDAAMKIKSLNAKGQQQSSGDLRAAAAYMCVAILLIFFNKTAFSRYHFNAPNVLTLSQNVGSLIMLMVAKQCKWLDYQSFSMRNFRRLLPLSLAFIAYVVFGMWAMKVVNIPMYTTLRRMSILFVMLMEWFISRKSSTYTVKLSVLIMLLGAGIAGYRDLNFDVQAYGIVILFNLCTAIYLVLINQISTEEKSAAAMNGLTPPLQKYDFMYYNNLVSIPLVLILLGASGEGSLALSFTGWSDVGFQVALISSSVLAFVLNATIFWNTSVNSALTQTVSGQAKDVILVFIGYACFDDAHFDPVNMVGILVGFGGSIFYAVNKLVPSCAVEPFLLSMGCMETNKKDDTALTPVPSPGFGLLGGGNRLRRSPSQNYGGPSKCRTVTGWIVSCAIGAIIMTLVHRGGITTSESSDLQASMQQLPTTITNLLQPSAATIEKADADKKEASQLIEIAQSLNATVHYKHAFILQQRRLLERECVRQLIGAGWTREQTEQADDDTYWRMTRKELRSDRPTDPPTPTWSDEQHRAWVEMGCLDHVTWWRAYQQVQHNYAGLLKIQQDFELRRGAEVEKAGMQRGLYSLSHRREGQCGIGSDKLSCVIALSLFGSSPRYTRAIMSSVRRMSKIFPGWELRIYYDHTVPGNILTKLQSHADRVAHLIAQSDNGSLDPMIAPLKLVNVSATIWPVGSPELDRIHGSFYRYLVADDVTVDRWVSRDCDALLLKRDYLAVQEWMGSKWTWHAMADYPQHGLMLAGMWGAINYARENGTDPQTGEKIIRTMMQDSFEGRTMKQLIEEYTLSLLKPGGEHAANPQFYGVDQTFQIDMIWPKFRRDHIRHDSYHCHVHLNAYSFPSPREEPYVFIGQTEHTSEDGESQYDSAIRTEVAPPDANRRPSPVECRRKPEWLYG